MQALHVLCVSGLRAVFGRVGVWVRFTIYEKVVLGVSSQTVTAVS